MPGPLFLPIISLLIIVSHVRCASDSTPKGDDTLRPDKAHLPIPTNVDAPHKPVITPAANSSSNNPGNRASTSDDKRVSPLETCKFSCSSHDTIGMPLVQKASAFGWDFDGYMVTKGKGQTLGKGWYDIFECV
jgi:hypothetical protein